MTTRKLVVALACGALAWGALAASAVPSAHAQSLPLAGEPRTVWFRPSNPVAELQHYRPVLLDGIWIETWTPICKGTCTTVLHVDEPYRVSGPGLRSSDVTVRATDGALDVTGKTGSTAGFVTGILATSIGSVAMVGGLLMYGMAGLCALGESPDSCSHQGEAHRVTGAVALGGLVAAVAGIVLLVNNASTVKVSPHSDARPRP
jgi:hypothetical protein